jgi:hypothetical protein
MIAEIFITPDVFEAGEDVLRNRLSELAATLLPPRSTPRFVICQLDPQLWQKSVGAKIVAIKNHGLQSDAKALIMRLIDREHGVCVNRPVDAGVALNSEKDWVSAAKISSDRAPIDGIVASDAALYKCLAVEDFCSLDFWRRYGNPRLIGRNLDDQEPLLRTICLHSDWLLIRLPYLKGDDYKDEVATLKQILQLATNRFDGQSKCSIEVHVASRTERKGGDRKLKSDVEDQIDKYKSHLADLHVKVVPLIRERTVFAGEWAQMPHGKRAMRVRWLLTMAHVAIDKNREASNEPCSWSLYDRKQAHDVLLKIEQPLLLNEQ